MNTTLRRWLGNRDLMVILFFGVLVLAMYLPSLGSYAFWDPWEPHYAQVAKEMNDHKSWMDTWYQGRNNWWSKPILPLWLVKTSFLAFGITDPGDPRVHFAGRLPIVLIGLIGVLLTYGWVSRLYDRRTGIYAALILSTCPTYALLAHQIMFDLPFAAFCTPAIGYYILAKSPQGKPIHLYAFFILTGLAFLSKWLLAFYIPIGIFFAFLVVRWDVGVFRRIGGYYWLGAFVFLAACAAYFFIGRTEKDFAAMLTVCILALVLVFLMGRDAVVQMGVPSWILWVGFGLMMLVILPWHIFMISKHGWPFIREVVIYHHFDRAAGTIGKPEGTFDVFFKQIAFAMFPWISLVPAALLRLLKWGTPDLEGRTHRDLWIFLAAVVPWAAFSLFQTKFHHYIFPVVPFLAVITAVFLARARIEEDRASIRLAIVLAIPVAAVMVLDILHEYKWFFHTFNYYHGWPLPSDIDPFLFFGVTGAIWLLILAWLFFRRRIGTFSFGSLAAVAVAVTVFLTAWLLPKVSITFTLEPLYRAYMKDSGGKAPIAQYNGWLSRSVAFYFDNRAVDLSQAEQPNLAKAIDFLRRPERSFLVVGEGFGNECRSLLASLRPEVNKQLGKSLYVVFDKHPFSCLVSTQRDSDGEQKVKDSLVTELPKDAQRTNIDFDGKIELVGYQVTKLQPDASNPEQSTSNFEVSPGETFRISYFFKCTAPVGDDWLVFIHGDGPNSGAHRIFGDHAPIGGLLPTSEWKVGEIRRDDYEMVVPSNYPYQNFTMWMGFWKGPDRLPVTQKHQHDGANRVRTAFIRVR